MTVSNVKSTFVTNAESDNHAGKNQAGIKKGFSTVGELASAAVDNCVVVYGKIPVDANVTSLRWASDDQGTTGTVCLGLYPGTYAAGDLVDTLAVDENCFANDIDVNTAAVAFTEYRNQAANIDTTGKKAWEVAGLSAAPAYADFWVCATFSAATTAAGGTTAIDIVYI